MGREPKGIKVMRRLIPKRKSKTSFKSGKRRSASLLYWGSLGLGVILIASCGSSGHKASGNSGGNSSGSTGALNATGVLRYGMTFPTQGGDKVTFDPTQALFPSENVYWELAIYDTLLHRNTQTGAFTPGLATSATVVSPTTMNITLRNGVKFSDGTPFNAEAVEFGLMRNKDATQRGEFNASIEKIQSIDVTSPLQLTIHFPRRWRASSTTS